MKRARQWVTPAELAEELGKSVTTLQNWRTRGDGPPWYNLGGVRYDRADIDKWYEANKHVA